MNNNWKTYHQQTKSRQPSALLSEALNYVKNKNKALDLGAGALVETKFLLSQGFKDVVAVDTVFFEDIDNPHYTFVQSSFENYSFPQNTFDIINAQFSLPFNKPGTFNSVWNKVKNSLVGGGIFSGQLFGLNDSWNTKGTAMTFHSKEQVEQLLNGMEIVKLEEIKKDAPLASGEVKHWHIFAIIAKRSNIS